MFAKLLLVAAVASASDNSTSPDSWCAKSFGKCHCSGTVTFDQSCDEVRAEISARILGAWVDPHHAGTYTFNANSTSEFDTVHKTGKSPHYEDKQSFGFADTSNGGCTATVCSTSTVLSGLDAGTNFCDIHDLYCSDAACKATTKLTYKESISCSSGQSGSKNCY